METSHFLYFLVGAAVCFIGTLPFGPVNLTVVKITVERDHRRGFEVAMIASFVEILHALIAILFGMVISEFLAESVLFKLAVALLFLAFGVIIWRKDPPSQMRKNGPVEGSGFKSGLLVSLLNPQAIPFWIFALALISSYTVFYYEGLYLVFFLAGVSVGKFAALAGFVFLSQYLKSHLRQSGRLVNQLLAAVLLVIGLTQIIRLSLAALG